MDQQNQTSNNSTSGGFLQEIENEIAKIYSKITFHLPVGLKDFIVHYGPWIALILMVIAIPAILLALGIGAFATPFVIMHGGSTGIMFFVSGLISLFALILEAMALPGLFKRQLKGWHLMLYSVLVSAVGSLVAMNWGGLIIGTAISLYILFEVKSYYK